MQRLARSALEMKASTRDVSFRFVSFRLVYLPIHIRFVSFKTRTVSFRFDYTKTIENNWNNKTKRIETFELILIDKSVGPQESGQRAGVGEGKAGRGRAGARWREEARRGAGCCADSCGTIDLMSIS